MRLSKRTFGLFFAGIIGATASTIIATPSFAATASCAIHRSGNDCTTGGIPANPSGHFVDYQVCVYDLFGFVGYEIWDVDTGVVVKSGVNQLKGCDSDRVYGLYGHYMLTLAGDPGDGSLDNN